MMSRNKKPDNNKSVFVGNIAYDTTEEQLIQIFSQAGPVNSLRLKFDRETGKPLGFGFVEYYDEAAAATARRNLNNTEINGRRLRVDLPTQSSHGGGGSSGGSSKAPDLKRPRLDSSGGPAPVGGEQVASVVANMTPQQVYQIVAQTKAMVDANPDSARALLVSNPQLCYAVLQAQVLLGMTPQLVEAARERKHREQEEIQMQQALQQQQRIRQQAQAATFSEDMIAAAFADLPESDRDMLIQVLSLSEAEIAAMPPQEQQVAMSTRQQALELLHKHN